MLGVNKMKEIYKIDFENMPNEIEADSLNEAVEIAQSHLGVISKKEFDEINEDIVK